VTTILHIDSSILGGYSVSRALTADIVARQQALHLGARRGTRACDSLHFAALGIAGTAPVLRAARAP
jgi:FMN-dependent NADH-azoreductase